MLPTGYRVRAALSAVAVAAWLGGAQPVLAGEGELPHRSWQFHDPDWGHLSGAIPKAARAGMNRIQLSHDIVMDAEQLWQGSGHEQRLELVRKCVALAHANKLAVDLWTHELSGLPAERFRDADTKKIELSEELWKWLDEKYEHLFALVPDLDGLVLTFAETDHRVYRDEVLSDLSPPQRVATLIKVLGDVCRRHGKILIVRTFVYEPAEIAFLHEALELIAAEGGRDGSVIVMTKCVPHDWTPYYPFNPLLGDVAGLPQVVEIDLGQEFTGQSKVLHCEVDYVKCVLNHARARGVIGGVARVERRNNHALGTPNEVNIHAFSRLLHAGELTAGELWSEWAAQRYGSAAAPLVILALRRTYDVTNLTFFPLEQWITNHSRLPDWGYAYGHITSRQNAKWIPSPRQIMARDELLRPTGDTLVRIDNEKDLAAALAKQSLEGLEDARDLLKAGDYDELKGYLELSIHNVEVFRRHQMAMFSLLWYQDQVRTGRGGDKEKARLAAMVRDRIVDLRQVADEMEQRFGGEVWPGNPRRIRDFAGELEKKLNAR